MIELRHNNETQDDVTLYLEGCGAPESEGEFSLPPGGWRRLLSLARIYGWHPGGTEAPEYPWLNRDVLDEEDAGIYWQGTPSEWDGRYFPGWGQHVTVDDARALGAALRRALPDLPDHEAFERQPWSPDGEASTPYLPSPIIHRGTGAVELYSGEWKRVLRGLIAHCLECGGGFWIWSYEDR